MISFQNFKENAENVRNRVSKFKSDVKNEREVHLKKIENKKRENLRSKLDKAGIDHKGFLDDPD